MFWYVPAICVALSFDRSAAMAEPEPSFYVSFDHALDAETARGDGKAVASPGLRRVPAKVGQGVQMGQAGESLRYAANKNVNPSQGTLAMWVKPQGISPQEIVDGDFEEYELFHLGATATKTKSGSHSCVLESWPATPTAASRCKRAPSAPTALAAGPARSGLLVPATPARERYVRPGLERAGRPPVPARSLDAAGRDAPLWKNSAHRVQPARDIRPPRRMLLLGFPSDRTGGGQDRAPSGPAPTPLICNHRFQIAPDSPLRFTQLLGWLSHSADAQRQVRGPVLACCVIVDIGLCGSSWLPVCV